MSFEESRQVLEKLRVAANELWTDVEAHVALFSDAAALKTYGGRDAMREAETVWRVAFPDWRTDLTHVVIGEDGFAFVAHETATNTGPLMGHPPTNRRIALEAVGFLKVADGLIVDAYFPGQAALLPSIFEQLGLPVPGA